MQKQVSVVVILVALAVVGWILYENRVLPTLNPSESYSENVGNGTEVSTTTSDTPVPGEAPAPGECYVGGCSGQICSDEPGMVSTCEYQEAYACYRTATCERQSTGQCGWTVTAELNMCLSNAR